MPIDVVLVPGAPVVVPELSGAAAVETAPLVAAGLAALRATAGRTAGGHAADGESARRAVVVTTGAEPITVPASRYDLRRFGSAVPVGHPGSPELGAAEAAGLPAEALLGWWWARAADLGPADLVVIPRDAGPDDRTLRRAVEALGGDGVVVVVADGPCALAPRAPIPLRPSAVSLDAALTAFLDDGGELISPDPETSRADGWYARTLWEQLAALTSGARGAETFHCAPFGVGYHVARWRLTERAEPRDMTRTGSARPGGGDLAPVVIVGPTGSGKSDLALDLAERLGGEIVNLDAMQMYRGMDIGTAKVPPTARRGIPHHLFDVLDVTETASVADYQEAARGTVEEIMARGCVPVIVGGSMLYFQSLVDEWEFPATDPQVRGKYEARLAEIGVEALHAELAAVDPDAARSILPTDPRRTVRALEVVELTGKPFAASRPVIGSPRWGARILGLDVELDVLDERLRRRTDAMFAAGLVDEVRALEGRGLRDGVTARRAIGYAQVLEALDSGPPSTSDFVEIIERVFVGTRRYVRRQRSWFRRDPRISWLDATPGREPGLLDQALAALGVATAGGAVGHASHLGAVSGRARDLADHATRGGRPESRRPEGRDSHVES